jgi:hypothetical protein
MTSHHRQMLSIQDSSKHKHSSLVEQLNLSLLIHLA